MLDQLFSLIKTLSGSLITVGAIIVLLIANSWLFNRFKKRQSMANILKRTVAALIIFVGGLILILALPIDKGIKGQILGFLGIIISAGIALSSTTVLGNLIAGFMNNSMNRFRNGDLINVGDLTGRVTKKSIFHTEIQLEDSNFVTIPNLYIASNPVKLTRKTNTVVSTSVSLGYDVSRNRIETALKEAALVAGLTDPYVYITNLGDYSVVYRIHGFLKESGKFFSTTSALNANVMDSLHKHQIEIVSPTFMNQRRVDDTIFIPKKPAKKTTEEVQASPEELIFDKAIKSEKIEKKKEYVKELDTKKAELKEKIKEIEDPAEAERLKASVEKLDGLKKRLEEQIKEQEHKNDQ
jgi:small-conductance mechanosensitive channel